MNALKSIQNKMANSGDYLGDEVFWSISDADIEPQVVRSLCVQHGLDVRLAPEYPTTEMAFGRAVDRLKARYVQRLAGKAIVKALGFTPPELKIDDNKKYITLSTGDFADKTGFPIFEELELIFFGNVKSGELWFLIKEA